MYNKLKGKTAIRSGLQNKLKGKTAISSGLQNFCHNLLKLIATN